MDSDRHREVSDVAVEVWTEPTAPDPAPDAPPPPGPDLARTVLRLKVALAAAVAVAVGLAGALYLTQRQSGEERAAEAAVAAYTDAWDDHDLAGVRAAMAGNGTFSPSDSLDKEPMFTAWVGTELERVLTKLFEADARLETTGQVIIAGDDPARASVTQRFSYTVYGLRVVEDGISHYTLGPDDDGDLKVVQHVWWRPKVPASPSMLWVLES